jgi:hypothetical protein
MSKLLSNHDKDSNLLTALETFIDVYREEVIKKSPRIPLSLFANRKLGILETAVKCLKENSELNYSKIANLLGRDPRTIWAAYKKSQEKEKERFTIKEETYSIPISIFCNRNLGPLEALILYLRDNLRLSFNQISRLLNRNYRTIWLSYQNALKKKKQNETKGEPA